MISHAHKVVFIHIPKCGGQSVETLFLKDLGLDWKNRDCLNLRKNPNKTVGPRTLSHLTARQYVELNYLSDDIWAKYQKFTIIRNPIARTFSAYKYLGFSSVMSFSHFVEKVVRPAVQSETEYTWFLKPQVDFISDDKGELCENIKVFKLEELGALEVYLQKSVFKRECRIPHVNASKAGRFLYVKNILKVSLQGYIGLNLRSAILDVKGTDAIHEIYTNDFTALGYA